MTIAQQIENNCKGLNVKDKDGYIKHLSLKIPMGTIDKGLV